MLICVNGCPFQGGLFIELIRVLKELIQVTKRYKLLQF